MTTPSPSEPTPDVPIVLALALVHDQNYGDHGERVTEAHVYIPGETLEQLAARVFANLGRPYSQHNLADVIEIRVAAGADGRPTGDTQSSVPPW